MIVRHRFQSVLPGELVYSLDLLVGAGGAGLDDHAADVTVDRILVPTQRRADGFVEERVAAPDEWQNAVERPAFLADERRPDRAVGGDIGRAAVAAKEGERRAASYRESPGGEITVPGGQ